MSSLLIFRWFESQGTKENRETLEKASSLNQLLQSRIGSGPSYLSEKTESLIPDFLNDIESEYLFEILLDLIIKEGSFTPIETPDLNSMPESDKITFRQKLKCRQKAYDRFDKSSELYFQFLRQTILNIYGHNKTKSSGWLNIRVRQLLPNFPAIFDNLVCNLVSNEFFDYGMFQTDFLNLRPKLLVRDKIVLPSDSKIYDQNELVDHYFQGSDFKELLNLDYPYVIPKVTRREHTHILGGSGHGKTELVKSLVFDDLLDSLKSGRSVVVMDSQGDLLNDLLALPLFHPENGKLKDKLILIDPNELHRPPALNLFALNAASNDPLLKERRTQSAVAQYTYLFGELLGAELTQRQGTLFAYLAQLMMQIPKANIYTLKDVLENGQNYKDYMNKLSGSGADFFSSKFFDQSFKPVKTQIINRLWGILSSGPIERMFRQQEMKLSFDEAFQNGNIILINTAKDLLKSESSSFLGKFMLSLMSHAIVERASIAPAKRNPVSIYVDEAHEYLDSVSMELFNQARKFDVSLTIAHQNLDQLDTSLRSSIAASTSVKFAGGLSDKDARAMAGDMRSDSQFLLSMRKRSKGTQFALYVRNSFEKAVTCNLSFDRTSKLQKLSPSEINILKKRNGLRFGADDTPCLKPVLKLDISNANANIPDTNRRLTKALSSSNKIAKTKELKLEGKGSELHRALQARVKKVAEKCGFRAELEKAVASGFVDVYLTRESEIICVEIAIKTDPNYEVQNIIKCLNQNPSSILIISPDKAHLESIAKRAANEPDILQYDGLHFITPDQLDDHIFPISEPEPQIPPPDYKMVNGYKVKVRTVEAIPLEQDERRRRLSSVIARSLGEF